MRNIIITAILTYMLRHQIEDFLSLVGISGLSLWDTVSGTRSGYDALIAENFTPEMAEKIDVWFKTHSKGEWQGTNSPFSSLAHYDLILNTVSEHYY